MMMMMMMKEEEREEEEKCNTWSQQYLREKMLNVLIN
jgi:hypothetical protein